MVANGNKKRKITHNSSDDESHAPTTSKRAQKDFFKHASNWNLEQDYESRPRKGKKNEKENTKLPIKSQDGRLELLKGLDPDDDAASIESDTEWLEGRDGGVESEDEEVVEEKKVAEVPEAQRILEAQEELAKAAMALNENPEENIGNLKTLAQIGRSKIPTIRMLALMTQMTVYKDIIPGYRIRPQSEDTPKEKLSKEVRNTRQFEQSLVAGYQAYIKELARCARSETTPVRGGQSLSNVAVTCACTLITSVPHFNFRSDILRILVGKLSRRKIDKDAAKIIQALETLFHDDEEGRPSLEAVSLITKMMKAKGFAVHESVPNLFLSLRLLSEFSGKASQDTVEQQRAQKTKKKREFRTKKERKAMKEQKSLDKDIDEDAEQGPADEEAAEKEDDEESVRNLTREALLCTVTAYALLAGQDAHNSRNDLHLDLSYFTTHLFRSLLSLSVQPDLENTRLSTSSATSKINVQTTTVLLLRSLTGILLPNYNIRQVPPLRLAAFTKQLMTTALQLPEKSSQAILALLNDVAHTHSKKINSLWNTEERKGNGQYNAMSDSVEGSNPFATTVWEGELLRKHFSPKVREGVKMLEKSMSG
ncbi:Nucleolar complex protein 3 [Metarhizium anisopliae]